MPIKKKKISELKEAGDLKGFYTIGYRLLGGVKESVKIGLEYIQTAYEKVVQATKDAISATTDMRQLEATVEENEEARETAESRRAAAEQSRQTAESERLEKENERISAEELRVSAETQRGAAEEERRTAEGDRVASEETRDAAETERKAAEAGRVTAEQARATEYAGIKTESEDVIAAHRSAVASANQAAIYANREGDTAKEKASLADAAAQAANTAATTIDDKMQTAINKLIAGAPDALDTLNELAAALGNDPNFATTIAAELGKKLNKTDIINDVVTGGVDKVLSAQQGVELAGQIVEMGKNAGGKMVLIPSAVLNLTNASTSNEILDAFGSKEAFIDIVRKVKEGAPLALDLNGILAELIMYTGVVSEPGNKYNLGLAYVDPLGTNNCLSFIFDLTGDIATVTIENRGYGYANIVNIPSVVFSLNSDSTSDQIITAFGGKAFFDSIIEKVRVGNAIGIISEPSISISIEQIEVTDYIDANNVTLVIGFTAGGGVFAINIIVSNGVFAYTIVQYRLLVAESLVSDPSTGGTDIPASAEAVKVVNESKLGKNENAISANNADTVDNYHASQLLYRHDSGEGSWKANDVTNSVFGFGYPSDGFPTVGSFLSFTGLGDRYATQIQGQYTGGNIYYRSRNDDNGTWNGWRRILPSDNPSVDADSIIYMTATDGNISGLQITCGSNDYGRVICGGSSNAGYMEIATADDGTEPIYLRQYTGVFSSLVRTATLLDGNGNTYFPGSVHAPAGFWKDSDLRLKSHIIPLRHTLDQILAIPTAGFVMNGKQQIGTIAQEVEKICPEVVSESFELKSQVPERDDWEVFVENDHEGNPQEYVKVKRVEYEMLGVLALEGVKLLKAEIDELKDELKRLRDGRD